MKKVLAAVIFALFIMGCGSGVSYSTVPGNVNILNGPTSSLGLSKKAVLHKATTALALENGTYALAPSRMTLTVTGISFIPEGKTQYDNIPLSEISGCTATFDRTAGSLSVLRTGDFAVPPGTYCGVAIRVRQTFTMVINDTEAGIYSDPASPSGLTTTPPAGGGQPIQIHDQNSDGDGESGPAGCATYFDAPITIDKGSVPQVYVVFDPTHWIKAQRVNGQFTAPRMGGNPPIVPSISRFGKAAYYSNIGTTLCYRMDNRGADSGMSLLFLYADSLTPISVTWQVHDLCSMGSGNCAAVAYNGNGLRSGLWGMLGLDSRHTLCWASPLPGVGNGTTTGYNGVFRMQELSTVGQTTTLNYLCTSNIPLPSSGKNYSSGAPDFTPNGALTLTLVAQ